LMGRCAIAGRMKSDLERLFVVWNTFRKPHLRSSFKHLFSFNGI
jgi:hypothetical protein